MEAIERMPIASFPDALYDEAIEKIARFSVGLIGIHVRDHTEVAWQSGSGTLVDLDGTLCIITADHVIEDVLHGQRIGLLIDWNGGLRRCMLDRNHLQFVRLARGPTQDVGPDLGAILLPRNGEAVATLHAHKAFYNLRKRTEQFATGYPSPTEGVWIPCGVLAEGSQALPPSRGFESVTGHWGMFGIANSPTETLRGDFDYLDLRGRPRIDPDMPGSFRGASGGGLWQARIARKLDGSLELREVVLSGIIFYETDVENDIRGLRCHGRASLHVQLVEAIRRHVSESN